MPADHALTFLTGLLLTQGAAAPVAAAPAAEPDANHDYWSEPRSDYHSRRRAFLEHAASARPAGLGAQVARLELGRGPLDEAAIRKGAETVAQRRDGADFTANTLLRIYSYGASPLLSDRLR